jgi:flagellar protein FlbD
MIKVRRLNGKVFYLNHNLIETIEDTPDTIVKLTNGVKYVVRDGADALTERIIAFNREIFLEKTRTENEGAKL